MQTARNAPDRMTIDYIVASLPALAFGEPPPVTREKFRETCGEEADELDRMLSTGKWADIETQLKNALAEARQPGGRWSRPAHGCSVYWRNRVLACFGTDDVARREELLDRVWWDAAGELADASTPLGRGALAAYAVRLGIAIKRAKISKDAGNAAFDRLTAETRDPLGTLSKEQATQS